MPPGPSRPPGGVYSCVDWVDHLHELYSGLGEADDRVTLDDWGLVDVFDGCLHIRHGVLRKARDVCWASA